MNFHVLSKSCMVCWFYDFPLPHCVADFNVPLITRGWVDWVSYILRQIYQHVLHVVVYHYYALLLTCISIHCGLLASEFSERSCMNSSVQSCLFCGLCLPCSVALFIALWIARRWVLWIFVFSIKPAYHFLYCDLPLLCSVACFDALWISSRWTEWIFMF